jgi:choline kinase
MTNTETAVLLVAGVGSRLRPLTDDRPKALMDLGGETILARALRQLIARGVHEIVLATGYRDDQIRRAVEHVPARVTLCPNRDYDSTQNSVSLALCRPALLGKSFYKLDGDVVFDAAVLERLDACPAELAVAVDSQRVLDAEAMKIRAEGARILEFGKALPIARAAAETIGIERLEAAAAARVFDAIERELAAGRRDRYYEDVYSELVGQGTLAPEAVEVGDLAWSEVDTFDDLERARALAAEVRRT